MNSDPTHGTKLKYVECRFISACNNLMVAHFCMTLMHDKFRMHVCLAVYSIQYFTDMLLLVVTCTHAFGAIIVGLRHKRTRLGLHELRVSVRRSVPHEGGKMMGTTRMRWSYATSTRTDVRTHVLASRLGEMMDTKCRGKVHYLSVSLFLLRLRSIPRR